MEDDDGFEAPVIELSPVMVEPAVEEPMLLRRQSSTFNNYRTNISSLEREITNKLLSNG